MNTTPDSNDPLTLVDPTYRLANKIISILSMIVGLAVIAFLALICAYLYALFVMEPSSGGRADSLNNIERVMLTMWERLVPIGQQLLRS